MLTKIPKVGDLVLYRYPQTRTDIPFRVTEVNESKGTIVGHDEAPGGWDDFTGLEIDMCRRELTDYPTDKAAQDLVRKKLIAYAKRNKAI